MRHRIAGYKLNRKSQHRRAMWRNMAVSLFTYGQITTTVPKAKSVQPFVEKLITLARKGDLASRRRVLQKLGDRIVIRSDDDENVRRNKYGEVKDGPRVVKMLFDEISPKFAGRDGGYTRIVRLGTHRLGDGADLCVIQLVGDEDGPQVSGQYSRRRDKANRRMEFAARLRKSAGKDETGTAAVEPDAAPNDDETVADQVEDQDAVDAEASEQVASKDGDDAADADEKKQ